MCPRCLQNGLSHPEWYLIKSACHQSMAFFISRNMFWWISASMFMFKFTLDLISNCGRYNPFFLNSILFRLRLILLFHFTLDLFSTVKYQFHSILLLIVRESTISVMQIQMVQSLVQVQVYGMMALILIAHLYTTLPCHLTANPPSFVVATEEFY